MYEAAWRPVATARQEARILPVLAQIATTLWERRAELNPTLGSGLAGAALFLGYLGLRPGWAVHQDRALELLAMAVEGVARAPGLGLYAGFPGIAWCVEHLGRRVFPPGARDPNREVDAMVLDGCTSVVDYDLVRGLVGLGVYGLERWPEAGGALLRRVLDRLEDLAVPAGPGLAWATPPGLLPPWLRQLHPGGHLNFGLAHGIPGVVALLAALRRAGLEPDRCDRLLAGGWAFLLDQVRAPGAGSFLPAWRPLAGVPPEPRVERIAWCYGDLGASLALRQAATLPGPASWAALPLAMARLTAARAPEASGVRDAGLCHGAAGIAHLFNRWHHLTGAPAYRAAAQLWLDRTLDFLDPAKGFAGVTAFKPDPEAAAAASLVPCAGLLEGAAGVGLALGSALGGPAPAWDRFLLVSTAVPG